MLVSAIISILDDFDSLLPARTVTVKLLFIKGKISNSISWPNFGNFKIFVIIFSKFSKFWCARVNGELSGDHVAEI